MSRMRQRDFVHAHSNANQGELHSGVAIEANRFRGDVTESMTIKKGHAMACPFSVNTINSVNRTYISYQQY